MENMAENTEQTIRQYAKISEIPLKQVLDDLKNFGFSCNADDVVNREMRMKLSAIFRERVKKLQRVKNQERVKQAEETIAKTQEEVDELDRQISEAVENTNTGVKAKNHAWGVFKSVFEPQGKVEVQSTLDALKQQKEIKLKEKAKAISDAAELKRRIESEEKADELARRKKAEAEELKRQKVEAEKLKQQKEDEEFVRLVKNTESEARKIGQLLDLCCELIPAPIAEKIISDCQNQIAKNKNGFSTKWTSNNEALSGIFLNSFYKKLNTYIHTNDLSSVITIPKWIIGDYGIGQNRDKNGYSLSIPTSICIHKKHNRYTAALIETIYFLLTNQGIKHSIIQSYSPFKELQFVGELLIGISAIDSALKLYNIDERVFNSPNTLSLLANKAVQSGNLNDSIKLIGKLIEQEPYHPSIPIIQAEIKRLEQRHRLKATFSIDFSKVDELSGVEFENLLLDKFAAMGFKAESTPKTGDFGADLIVENKEGTRIIVQCKRFK